MFFHQVNGYRVYVKGPGGDRFCFEVGDLNLAEKIRGDLIIMMATWDVQVVCGFSRIEMNNQEWPVGPD